MLNGVIPALEREQLNQNFYSQLGKLPLKAISQCIVIKSNYIL